MTDMARFHALLETGIRSTTNPHEARNALAALERFLKAEGKTIQDLTFGSVQQVVRAVPTFVPASKLRQQVMDLETALETAQKKNRTLTIEIDRLTADNKALKTKLGDTSTRMSIIKHANKRLNKAIPEDQRKPIDIPVGDARVINLSERTVKDRRVIFITLLGAEKGMTDNALAAILSTGSGIHDATVRSTRALMVREGFVRGLGKVKEFASRNRASGVATGRTVSCDAWAAIGTLEDFDAAVARSQADVEGKQTGKVKPSASEGKRDRSNPPIDWTTERKNRVRDLVADDVSSKRIAEILTKEFGQEVTLNAVNGQKNQLGGWKQPRKANAQSSAAA